jgi:hypothetical protein
MFTPTDFEDHIKTILFKKKEKEKRKEKKQRSYSKENLAIVCKYAR